MLQDARVLEALATQPPLVFRWRGLGYLGSGNWSLRLRASTEIF